jgi:hypothetical protein
MIVCISGQRGVNNFNELIDVLLPTLNATLIIFGDCNGVDAAALRTCIKHKIPYKVYAADWKTHGKAAGPIRNKQMIDDANILYAFHLDIKSSKGTRDTIKHAKKKKIPYHLIDN